MLCLVEEAADAISCCCMCSTKDRQRNPGYLGVAFSCSLQHGLPVCDVAWGVAEGGPQGGSSLHYLDAADLARHGVEALSDANWQQLGLDCIEVLP